MHTLPSLCTLHLWNHRIRKSGVLCQVVQSLHHLYDLSVDLLCCTHVCLALGSPELDPEPPMWSHHCSVDGKDHLPQPAGSTFPATVLVWLRRTLLAHLQLSHQEHPKSFYAKLFSRWSATSMGLFFPRCSIWYARLLNFLSFFSVDFCSLSTHLWVAAAPRAVSATPPTCALCADLLRMRSAPLSRSLNEKVKQCRPQCQALGLVLSAWRAGVLLVATLWAQPLSHFSVHLTVHFP